MTKSLHQQIKSATALQSIRQAEAMAGHTVGQHYRPFRQFPQLLATTPRRHKANRQESKARARWMGLYRFFRPESFHDGEYGLGL